ncbi:ATP-binding protein [Tardibacter chloracetimidivorans]|uniref:ATP-binding protein n=1 Tax=Tardibacter chloracetimidivorans TaxID=1921510 RepID=A0A1L3ZTP5_9SPHN|nr:ATP-binding protein [Tardibacter chloracetimidivorans]API59003.1 ATP-binding protein [Tardibacter chloracetimidivorans]
MKVGIDMGLEPGGKPAMLDLEELLATRLLVQGNSGSGKSHLLRRLIEQSAEWVQQAIIDPEGDFVTLADHYGHIVVEAADYSEADVQRVAARVREHRASVVLNLEGLDVEAQMRSAAAFLGGLFDAHRDHWYPVLVVVDEAQLFAPSAAGEVSDEARKTSLGAMTNLMCRGRKRGLAGVIATQRLAKLAKNVAAEASNFLMGRTFLDIDMARAADLLGMEKRTAEMFRDLERGHFVALGPAVSRRPLPIRIGEVQTSTRSTSPKLMPPPATSGDDLRDLIFAPAPAEPRRAAPPPPPPPPGVDDLLQALSRRPALEPATPAPAAPDMPEADRKALIDAVLREIISDPDASYRSIAVLYQDFLVRCRIHRLPGEPLDLPAFRRRLTIARAGVGNDTESSVEWSRATEMAGGLSEDIQGLFLLIARAALDQAPCPSDAEVARVCGSRSTGRAKRLLAYMESQGLLVCRNDLRGNRIIALPELGWTTAPGDAAAQSDMAL